MAKKKTIEQELVDLHGLLIRELTQRVKSGECTTADLNCARQFLKDNNIDSMPTEEGVAQWNELLNGISVDFKESLTKGH